MCLYVELIWKSFRACINLLIRISYCKNIEPKLSWHLLIMCARNCGYAYFFQFVGFQLKRTRTLSSGKGKIGDVLTLFPSSDFSFFYWQTFVALQVSDQRVNLDISASYQSENGSISTVSSTVSSVESEKAAYEFLAQTPIKSTDAHLVEFSEAMRSKETQTSDDPTWILLYNSYIYICCDFYPHSK